MFYKIPQQTIKISDVNFNTDRRLNPELPQGKTIAEAFADFHPSKRVDNVKPLIKNMELNEIMVFFEIDDSTLELFINFCSQNSIFFKVKRYNPTELAFSYIVMTRDNSFLSAVDHFPLTTDGTYCEDHERPKPGEKPSEEYSAKILGDNFEKTVIRIRIGDIDIYVAHLGLSNKAKITQTKKIVEIMKKESIACGREVILGGDLNCFDVSKPGTSLLTEQLDLLKEVLKWHTKDFKNTFTAFPYDIVFKMNSEEKTKYNELIKNESIDEFRRFCYEMADKYGLEGGALDHVFASETLNLEVKLIRMYPTSDHDLIEILIKLGK